MKLLIDLFDFSGNVAAPYKINGWEILQVDIKHGIDILTWDYKEAIYSALNNYKPDKHQTVAIIAAIPCTDYALSGAKHFAAKDKDGRTEKSNLLVSKTKEIIDWVNENYNLKFWYIENPMSRIHKLNPWMGEVKHKFNPCNYAGYAIDPEKDRYNKMTWLWGNFNKPKTDGAISPIFKENPGWLKLGGGSERTKELRSITPTGFCQAFFESNS